MRLRKLAVVLASLPLACIDTDELVPATVVDNPDLPQLRIEVDGHSRAVHVRELGQDGAPVLLLLHGSASDMRAYLPLGEALADRYHVVLWDLRGNGLSERVPADELGFDDVVEEIEAMRQRYSPAAPVTLIGHSWSAAFVALYLGAHPEGVDQAVLIEPPGLTGAIQQQAGQSLSLLAPGYLDLSWSVDGLTPSDHASLDFALLAMLQSGVRNFHCDPDDPPPWPVWRPGGVALVTWESSVIRGGRFDYDFSEGLAELDREILLVGSSCSPIGAAFQADNAALFGDARVVEIEDSGHRILTERFDALVAALDGYLAEPPP